MARRRLLLAPCALLLAGACADGVDPALFLPQAAAAGDATPTTAVLWAETPNPGAVEFVVRSETTGHVAATAQADATDPLLPVKVLLTGLEPHTGYRYSATDSAGVTVLGRFVTPAAPGQRVGLRFGVVGDWSGDLLPYPALSNAASRRLDFFVALGDTVYADVPSPGVPLPQATMLAEFRAKHQEVYATRHGMNTLRQLRSSAQLYATIDDHEVTDDWSGGADPATDPRFPYTTEAYVNETALYRTAMQAFFEYNPIAEEAYGATGDPRTAGKPKLYRYRTFGDDAAIFLLDARSFRDKALANADPTDPASVDDFLAQSFDPTRTMLGAAQLADLEADLLDAEQRGITWKFVLVPEPIQNLGVLLAADRFEGYAAERSRLLRFVRGQAIRNVVFIAADFHCTLVNNLAYQTSSAADPRIPVDAFEVVVSAVAVDPPLGVAAIELATEIGILSEQSKEFYDSLTTMAEKDAFFQLVADGAIHAGGHDALGLAGSSIPATLDRVDHGYVYGHSYGWAEFEVDARSRELTVTVFGIPYYSVADLATPENVVGRKPAVLTRFRVAAR